MSLKSVLNHLLCAFLAALSILLPAAGQDAQAIATPSRITRAIDEANTTVLRGNTHPLAQTRFDQGAAPDSLAMQRMLLVLKRSPPQEAALRALLDQQQDSSSPNYHRWLTPRQFGRQFGPSDRDIQAIANWLQSHGFTVASVSSGRTVIEFSGTAGQIREAFRTEMHRYAVSGEDYWANSSDPQIPEALAPVVAGINTLYNFPRRAMHEIAGVFNRSLATGAITPAPGAQLTFPNPCSPTSQPFCNFALGPADFARIYNVPNAALVPAAATQYNGNNQTVVVVGQSDIKPSDIAAFRTYFGLPPANLNVIVNGPDPGFDPGGTETEADLDLEWAGAVAPNASIDYVVAQPTETSLGVDLAAQYAVDNNLGSVLSESYGICELFMGAADNVFYNQLWQQAAAQGITVAVATGDAGSAVCDQNVGTQGPTKYGLSVNGFASTPYNTAVGGTDFNDLNLSSEFWNTTPADTPTQPSALGYIPEMTWNDTCTNQELFSFFGVTNAEGSCNNAREKSDGLVNIGGGSGGQSNCTASDGQHPSSCSGGYPKPSWQVPLTPADATRDIPDVSLFASNGFNGSFYIVCEQDFPGKPQQSGTVSCDPFSPVTSFIGVGGTSASTPAFAGIMALVDQATGSPQGNADYILYKLAAQSGASCPSAANPASNCIFYDVPAGSTIAMACAQGSPDEPNQPTSRCPIELSGDTVGVLSGYNSASGYDLATGLGSVNAANLISAWRTFETNLTPTTTTLTLNGGTSAINITHGQPVSVSVNVAPMQGTGAPAGAVSLIANTGVNGTQSVASSALSAGSQSATFSTNALPGGSSYTVDAHYPGDVSFAPSTSNAITVTVSPESSSTKISVINYSPESGRVLNSNASTVTYGSPYLLRADVTNASGSACIDQSTRLQAYGCPTGNITFAADGSPLPGTTSVLALNSQGYAENQSVQLPAGMHSLTVSYAGDNSYTTSSSAATALTVTPAPTTTVFDYVSSLPSQIYAIGSTFPVYARMTSNSFGVLPTGTFTVFDGGQAIATSSLLTGDHPPSTSGQVEIGATINTKLSAPSGPHTLTVKYNGDSNYAGSTSPPTTVSAVYLTTMTVKANPASIIYGGNTAVTITATLDTPVPASNSALAPTGALSFSVTGTVSTTIGPDPSGNWMIQSTITISPQESEQVSVGYAGDANYTSASGYTFVAVTIPGFTVTVPSQPLAIVAGTTGTATLTVTPQTNYTSTVTLTCTPSFHPANSVPGATCTFSPPSVTLANGAPATVTLSLATLPPSSVMSATSLPRRLRRILPIGSVNDPWVPFGTIAVIAAFLLFIFRRPSRFPAAACSFAIGGIFCFVIGCGGGASAITTSGGGGAGGGNGGNGTSGPTATTTAFSTTSTKLALGSSATLTATVESAAPLTGLLMFSDASFPYVVGSSPMSGRSTVTVQMTAQGSTFPGTHVITAQYQGDPNNKASVSGPLNIVVTGPTSLELVGQTGPDSDIVDVPVTIQ